ncbi:sulfotransferase family protein [Paracoccus siganidrum]|uniref:Sulfotransferase n=1 Tax=Paracoccus siganidrum TaxID=1276757 RepID=A0A419A6L5_9RHOB|nr:sulfotransferase [Paracoccus siganidrum]RJL14201.1 sulfotransferase [Paracoccus siganidrum]RMC33467.1 sulfotransferase [Paracoccus siganidrum]
MTAFDVQGKPRKPAILGIGAQKAGTSWLAQMLGQHPQIWIPPFKEVQYFNHLFIPEHRRWIGWHYRNKPQEIRERHKRRDIPMPPELDAYLEAVTSGKMFHNHWYKRIFAPAPEIAQPMDFTPEYSTLPEEGVDYVANFLPKAKIIYLIRHPVDRAVSQLRMNLRREKRQPATLADWLAEIENPVLDDRGDYAAYLPRWQARYPDMLVLPFGRIARDPEAVMEAVEDYLGIGPFPYLNLHQKVFASPEGLRPPPEAIRALAARMQPQIDFLAAHLGEEFAAEIR